MNREHQRRAAGQPFYSVGLLASDQRFSANFQGQGRRPMAESLWAKIKLESCFYDSQTKKKLRSFADVSYRNTKLSISQAEPRA